MQSENLYLIQNEPRGASQLIETPVPVQVPGVTKVTLPDVQNLRDTVGQNIIVKALRVIPDTVLAVSPLLGLTVAPLAELQKMSLTLYSERWEKGQLIPICSLIDIFTEASGIPWRAQAVKFADWKKVDWPKSFITYSNGTSAVGAPYAVLFEVEFVKLDADNNEIKGAQ